MLAVRGLTTAVMVAIPLLEPNSYQLAVAVVVNRLWTVGPGGLAVVAVVIIQRRAVQPPPGRETTVGQTVALEPDRAAAVGKAPLAAGLWPGTLVE